MAHFGFGLAQVVCHFGAYYHPAMNYLEHPVHK